MKIYAVNGSPRKNSNTATLLQKALEGVKSSTKGAEEIETEIINLYDLKYTGCKSCFVCKRIGGSSYGKCAVKDELYAVLNKLSKADGIIFGSPVYFSMITGQMHSMLERLIFPYTVYDENYSTIAPKRMPTAFIYTMNVTEQYMNESNYMSVFGHYEPFIESVFTKPVVMYANDTYQFADYSKYKSDVFSEEEKRKHREVQFPVDCQKAFNLGKNLLS